MVKVKRDEKEIEVSEKAYEVVYKPLGFKEVKEKKKKSDKE
ncbi:hypothetical protein [Bacillus sp. MCCB 382]